MALENCFTQMEKLTMDNGKMENSMEKGKLLLQMEE